MPRIILNSIVGETHEDKKGDEHIKDIVLLYSAIEIEGKTKWSVYVDNRKKINKNMYLLEIKCYLCDVKRCRIDKYLFQDDE